jgi:hypothetical protein
MFTVVCCECGSKVHPVKGKDNKLYYSRHYIPGGVDSRGFCPNVSEVPDKFLESEIKGLEEKGEVEMKKTICEKEFEKWWNYSPYSKLGNLRLKEMMKEVWGKSWSTCGGLVVEEVKRAGLGSGGVY